MFRITVCSESGTTTRLIVEGKLCGPCVGELEKSWQTAVSGESKLSVVVDLSGVAFVDASGKELLTRMHQQGVDFVAPGIMPKCVVEEIESAKSIR